MKQFIRGERALTLARVTITLAVVAVFVVAILVVSSDRSTAKDSQRVAKQATTELTRLRTIITTRCHQREVYDQRFVTKTKSDVVRDRATAVTWQKLYDATKDVAIPADTDPAVVKAYREQQAAILEAVTSSKTSAANGQAIVDKGAIGGCQVYSEANK